MHQIVKAAKCIYKLLFIKLYLCAFQLFFRYFIQEHLPHGCFLCHFQRCIKAGLHMLHTFLKYLFIIRTSSKCVTILLFKISCGLFQIFFIRSGSKIFFFNDLGCLLRILFFQKLFKFYGQCFLQLLHMFTSCKCNGFLIIDFV